jgi:hypothetical protein
MYRGIWWESLSERDHMEDTGVDGRIILKWIIREVELDHELHRSG